MKDTLCILPISLLINDIDPTVEKRKKRKEQYINGISQFIKLNDHLFLDDAFADIILIDNTSEYLDEDIKYILPNYVKYIGINGNKYGSINKGAGLLECWNFLKKIIQQYKYIIHFEPRQFLINNKFIETFIKNKNNHIKIIHTHDHIPHFYTGLFSITSENLLSFLNIYNEKELADKKISIEFALFDFMKNKNFINITQLNLYRYTYDINSKSDSELY